MLKSMALIRKTYIDRILQTSLW